MLLQYLLFTLQISTFVLSLSISPEKVVHSVVRAKENVAKNSDTKAVIDSVPISGNLNKLLKVSAVNISKPIEKLIGKPKSASSSTDSSSKVLANSAKPKKNNNTLNNSNKVFRMLGQPIVGYQHADGKFDHLAYTEAMGSLATRQKYTQYQPDFIPKVTKRSKRQVNNSNNTQLATFGTDVSYQTPLITTLAIGTPPQQIPLFMNLETCETVIFDSKTSCASGGFDMVASPTAMKVKSYDGGLVVLEGPSGTIDMVKVQGEYVEDFVSFVGFNKAIRAGFLFATLNSATRTCYGQLGMSLVSPRSNQMSLFQAFENFVGPSIFISMLVSAIHPLTYPIVYRIEIMIGGYESSKFVGPLNIIAVSKTRGAYTKFPWKLEFGEMVVNGRRTTGYTADTVTFSVLHVGIHLKKNLVRRIYQQIGDFQTYKPINGGPEVYTYLCKQTPVVSFTVSGLDTLFHIHPDDFNMGFHPDLPEYCIGAVQLPNDNDGPVHTIGLVFYKSWYTTFNRGADNTPVSIGLAQAKA